MKGMNLKEPLTVDVNIAADVGAAKRVGNLAGDGLCKEGVVHKNLICVSRDLLDYTSSFGPPDKIIEKAQEGEDGRNEEANEKAGVAFRQFFKHPHVNSILLCDKIVILC